MKPGGLLAILSGDKPPKGGAPPEKEDEYMDPEASEEQVAAAETLIDALKGEDPEAVAEAFRAMMRCCI